MSRLLKLQSNRFKALPFIAVFLTSCLAIGLSFYAEFVMNYAPCLFCQIQRGLYLLLAPTALVGVIAMRQRAARYLCLSLLAINCGVASYQSLIQFRLIKDPCDRNVAIATPAAYKNLLLNREKKKTPCSEIQWKIAGLPISTINGITSLALFCMLLIRLPERDTRTS
jgi:disulfide bond formation protein DsbB